MLHSIPLYTALFAPAYSDQPKSENVSLQQNFLLESAKFADNVRK
jgi:hypothetical protein